MHEYKTKPPIVLITIELPIEQKVKSQYFLQNFSRKILKNQSQEAPKKEPPAKCILIYHQKRLIEIVTKLLLKV